MPGIALVRYRSELSAATKSSKRPPEIRAVRTLARVPYGYIRLPANLAVKPLN